jgi:hypothetical protein
VPVHLLYLSLTGRFWDHLEQTLRNIDAASPKV